MSVSGERSVSRVDPLPEGRYTEAVRPVFAPLTRAAVRLACWQALLGLAAGVVLYLAGRGFAGLIAALGGAGFAGAGTCCVAGFFLLRGDISPERMLRRFYLAEFTKWALMALLFLLAFRYSQLEALSLLIGFIAAQFAAWPAFMYAPPKERHGR